MNSRPLPSLIRTVLTALILAAASAQAAWAQPATVSDEVAARALHEALRYADVTYAYRGEERQGVAYLYGGRMSVDQFLQAVRQGAEPGRDAGADASAVVVNAYRAAEPGRKFFAERNGARILVDDATSRALYAWNVQPVSVDELRPGDLIFFHDGRGAISGVAIFERRSGPNVHFVVASASAGRVIRTFLNVNNEYWRTRVHGAGRLLAIEP